jgi:1,2-diacylglycerol 3-alpha-glucosyltransferase
MQKPKKPIIIVQTCIPDYRLPVFDQISLIAKDLLVLSGNEFFAADIVTCAHDKKWYRPLVNKFFLRRSVLYQSGLTQYALSKNVIICEFNPRILSNWLLLLIRCVTREKIYLWGHTTGKLGQSGWSSLVRGFMGRLSDGIICYSETQANQLRLNLKHTHIWSAPNSCIFSSDCWISPNRHPRNIVYVGRLTAEKKPILLIKAIASLNIILPHDVRLIIVGDGAERVAMENLAETLGVLDRIQFKGHISDIEQLREIYSNSLLAVSPGYVGLSAIQAMAFGVPILVSSNENHSPEIEACVVGFTAEYFVTDSVESLTNKITDFFNSSKEWVQRRSQISEFIKAKYSIEAMAVEIAKVGHTTDLYSKKNVALCFSQYGPYHLSRARALEMELSDYNLFCVGISKVSLTYKWEVTEDTDINLIHLCSGAVENLSFFKVFTTSYNLWRNHVIHFALLPSYSPKSSLALLLSAKLCGVICIMMNDSHAGTSQAKGMLHIIKRYLVSLFSGAIVAGEPHRRYFESLGIASECIVTGYDAVDNDYFINASTQARVNAELERSRLRLPSRYLLSLGRMIEKKNLIRVVSAYSEYKRQYPSTELKLVFVGSGDQENDLMIQCRKLGLTHSSDDCDESLCSDVMFYGFKQIEANPTFYALSLAFVLASIYEEWGLVINEAMACGLPIIVSKTVGSSEDLVQHGVNGFHFDPNSTDELVECIRRIDSDNQLCERMGLASLDLIRKWGCDNFASNVRIILDRVSS